MIKTDGTSSCLSLHYNFMKGDFKMFFKFVKQKYKSRKEAKEREKRKAAFRKKMKELEIK